LRLFDGGGKPALPKSRCSKAFQATSLTPALAEKYAKELRWFLSVAEIGDGDVLLNVANLYNSTGGGVPRDGAEALRWYRLAADKGNEEALCFIGKMYETGDGVNQDFSDAMRWYQLAAEKGNAGAMFNIGSMHTRSQGVSVDPRELYFWFSLCLTYPLPELQANHAKKALGILRLQARWESTKIWLCQACQKTRATGPKTSGKPREY
jgi:TPR repeat protein